MKTSILRTISKTTFPLFHLALAVVFISPLRATALELDFFRITGNAATDVSDQFKVLVTDPTGGENLAATKVLFTFQNLDLGVSGDPEAKISEVYFDDGTLLGISTLFDADDPAPGAGDPGVDFTAGSASPGDLPGANNATPPFQVTAGFLADVDPRGQSAAKNHPAINVGESLGILFDLQSGKTLADTFGALQNVGGPGDDLRIGMHVQSIGSGGWSDSFINNPPSGGGGLPGNVVPEPGTLLLLGSGLLGVGGLVRKSAGKDCKDSS